jgi:hypothetical protein
MKTYKDVEKLIILDQKDAMLEINDPKFIPMVGDYVLDFESRPPAKVISVGYNFSESTIYVRVHSS